MKRLENGNFALQIKYCEVTLRRFYVESDGEVFLAEKTDVSPLWSKLAESAKKGMCNNSLRKIAE